METNQAGATTNNDAERILDLSPLVKELRVRRRLAELRRKRAAVKVRRAVSTVIVLAGLASAGFLLGLVELGLPGRVREPGPGPLLVCTATVWFIAAALKAFFSPKERRPLIPQQSWLAVFWTLPLMLTAVVAGYVLPWVSMTTAAYDNGQVRHVATADARWYAAIAKTSVEDVSSTVDGVGRFVLAFAGLFLLLVLMGLVQGYVRHRNAAGVTPRVYWKMMVAGWESLAGLRLLRRLWALSDGAANGRPRSGGGPRGESLPAFHQG